MNAPVPARFSLSQLSPSKIFLVILTGLVPAVLILLSPLPFWLRVWLWIPVLGMSVVLMFGKVGGRPMYSVLVSAWAYARRQRRHVWSVRKRPDDRQRVVARMSHQREHTGLLRKQFLEGAIGYGVATGVALSFALALIVGMRWVVTGVFRLPDTAQPARSATGVVSVVTPSPHLMTTPTSSFSAPTFSPSPTFTPALSLPPSTPTPTPATGMTWVLQEQEWNILAQSGSLVLENPMTETCEIRLAVPGWEYNVRVPGHETGRLLVIPALFPPTNGERLTVSSLCGDLQIALAPYQPYYPQRSHLWFVPVCIYHPHCRVRVRPGGAVEVTVLDREGEPADMIPAVSRAGEAIWVPQPPAGSCWMYRIVSHQDVWVEVSVYR